jgi:hypothetical protein
MRTLSIFLVSAMLVLSSFAVAQMPPILVTQYYNNISFITGGVGRDEQEFLQSKEVRGLYNLEIVIAAKTGSFLSNAAVVIRDANQVVVLDSWMNGPILMARLPIGRYNIAIQNGNTMQNRSVQLGNSHQRVVFHWDMDVERLQETEVSPEGVRPIIPTQIDGVDVITVEELRGEAPPVQTDMSYSEQQRRAERARQLREQSIRLEEEARMIESGR